MAVVQHAQHVLACRGQGELRVALEQHRVQALFEHGLDDGRVVAAHERDALDVEFAGVVGRLELDCRVSLLGVEHERPKIFFHFELVRRLEGFRDVSREFLGDLEVGTEVELLAWNVELDHHRVRVAIHDFRSGHELRSHPCRLGDHRTPGGSH